MEMDAKRKPAEADRVDASATRELFQAEAGISVDNREPAARREDLEDGEHRGHREHGEHGEATAANNCEWVPHPRRIEDGVRVEPRC